jgi:hypothetical protein
MPITLMQLSSVQYLHAPSSIAFGDTIVSSNTCRGIPPRISKRSRHALAEKGNNGAITPNSVSVQIGM